MITWLKHHSKFFYFLFILGLFTVAFLLRLRPALIRPIIFDESFTVVYLIKFNRVIDIINADASIPPLHYLLIKLMSLVSTKLIWLRFPSIIYSMLSLALIYKWIKRYSQKAALFTLIFLTFSTFQITIAWQAYVYSQLFFFGLLSIYFFYQLFYEGKSDWWRLLGFFVFSLAAWFTHYGYIWTLVGISFAIIRSVINNKFKFKILTKGQKRTIQAFLLIMLCLLIYAPTFLNNLKGALLNVQGIYNLNIYIPGEIVLHHLGLKDSNLSIKFIETRTAYIIAFLLIVTQTFYWIKKIKEDKKNQNYNFLVFMIIILTSNIIFPIIASLVFQQSVVAERSIIVASLPINYICSLSLATLWEKNKIGRILTASLMLFYTAISININEQNLKYYNQLQEAGKEYVDWFIKHPGLINNNLKILFYNSSSALMIPPEDYFDYTSFDYYWYGYYGKYSLPEYQKITINTYDLLHKDIFYLLVMYGSEGNLTEKISLICQNPRIVYQVSKYDWLNMNIYKCNE